MDHKRDFKPISRLAMAALFFGVLSLVLGLISGAAAIVCGHIARSQIKSNPSLRGSRMALAGLVLGYLTTALGLAILLSLGKPVTPLLQTLR